MYSGQFKDVNGIGHTCYTNYSIELDLSCGTRQFITVDNGKESDKPVLSTITFSTTSLDVSSESKDIVVTLRVEDESGHNGNLNALGHCRHVRLLRLRRRARRAAR